MSEKLHTYSTRVNPDPSQTAGSGAIPSAIGASGTDMLGAWRKIAEHALTEIGAPDGGLAAGIAGDFTARCWERMGNFPPTSRSRWIDSGSVSLALVTNGDRSQQRRKITQILILEAIVGAGTGIGTAPETPE